MIFLVPIGSANVQKKWPVFVMLLVSWSFLLLFTFATVVILTRNVNMSEEIALKKGLFVALVLNIIGGFVHFLLTFAVVERKSSRTARFFVLIYLIYQSVVFLFGVVGFILLLTSYPEYIYEAGFGAVTMLLFVPTLIFFFFHYLRFLRSGGEPRRGAVGEHFPNVVYSNEVMPGYIAHPHAAHHYHEKKAPMPVNH